MTPEDLKNQLELVAESEVAALRDVTIPSLRNERAKGKGPPYQKIGRRVFYNLKQLRQFLAASTVTPKRAKTLIDGKKRSRMRA